MNESRPQVFYGQDSRPQNYSMKIEAIVTCVNYSDFLAETLPENKRHFDHVTVVTSNDDRETLELCRRLSVACHMTDKFHKTDVAFNKALAINHGLKMLRFNDWVAHIDADTVLCPSAGHALRNVKTLKPENIYGCLRFDCRGYDRWRKYRDDAHSGHDYDCRVLYPQDMPALPSISLLNDGGYVPIGYFQLWNIGASSRHYPVHMGTYATAERTDVAFASQWDEGRRILLPEFFALHLGPKSGAPLGCNWSGRNYEKSPRFGPGV